MKKIPVTKFLRPGGIWHRILIAAIFVYALIVELLSRSPSFEGTLSQSDITYMPRTVFIVMGLVSLAIAFILLLRPRIVRLVKGWDQLSDIWGSVGMVFMLVYAVLESIAIYGLFLFGLTEERLDFYGFAAISLVSLLLLWTQTDRWDRLTRQE
jgi:hypothetical protein